MEDTSQPLSDGAPVAPEDTQKKSPRRPRRTSATTQKTSTSTTKTASQSGETVSDALAEPAVTASPNASSGTPSQAKKPKGRSRTSTARKAPTAPNEPQEAASAGQIPVLSESRTLAVHKSMPPALLGNKELALVEPKELALLTPEGESPSTPQKRRRRRGGRGRKRPNASTTAANGQAADEPLIHETGQTVPAVVSVEVPALSEQATMPASDGQPASPSATKDKRNSRSRTARSRGKKHGAEAPAPENAVGAGTSQLPPPRPGDAGYETLPFTAETPLALVRAEASVLSPVPVVNTQEASPSNRTRRRGRGATAGDEASTETAAPSRVARLGKAANVKPELLGRKLLVTVVPGDLVEVVVLDDGAVSEYYIEMTHQVKIRGNIYKGVISNIDTNLQAAFVNYGAVKNGFLQIDEIHPEYYLSSTAAGVKGHKYPPIQKVMKAGQEVLVQVGKEPTGNKGAFLTTWVSLAGRFLVLTPGQEQIGISRKVEDAEERSRLRELIKGLVPGEGLGAIVRTVSAGATKTTMQKDLNYLKRLWRDIRKKGMQEKAPALVHEEPGLAARSVRDYLTEDITEVWVDDETTATSMREMVSLLFPRKADMVKLHTESHHTLLERFGALKQIEQIHAREVDLPSGGRLCFDQTEALMSIDINSGKSGGNTKANFETMALRTNMEAATMIPQQLRLRDIGGQIVIDFIEMRDHSQVREVERTLHAAMKNDRARHDIGKMSAFGLLQIVRQRTGSSAISISMEACPVCQGTGTRRNIEWQALQALRDIHRKARQAHESGQTTLVYAADIALALYLLNHKRERIAALEESFELQLEIQPQKHTHE